MLSRNTEALLDLLFEEDYENFLLFLKKKEDSAKKTRNHTWRDDYERLFNKKQKIIVRRSR